jgi:hypothetical protein
MPYYLFCAECSSATNACERGWRAFLTDEESEPTAVGILCPECAEREFGPRRNRTHAEED